MELATGRGCGQWLAGHALEWVGGGDNQGSVAVGGGVGGWPASPTRLVWGGVIGGRAGQGEGLKADRGGGGLLEVGLVRGRGCRKLAGRLCPLLGLGGLIRGRGSQREGL